MSRLRPSIAPWLLPLVLACATTPPTLPDVPQWNEDRRRAADALAVGLREREPRPTGLVVRLAFEAGADLDLYVTDPRLETVYYANTPIVSGGRLEADRRCAAAAADDVAGDDDADAARVESVRFDAPLPGRYRIGVDFPHRCEGGPDEVPYVLTIEVRGRRAELRGLARWLEFTTIVHEFDVE